MDHYNDEIERRTHNDYAMPESPTGYSCPPSPNHCNWVLGDGPEIKKRKKSDNHIH